ncbi:c-type cytochrome [Roseateles saccharophilus]|uniref:Cytochrome c n=1 Tax=Roseateles saccharophilus TaxID=304 RepID=A0A4R3V509_ROSSA|nr:c-type cytochrome [Roseateles saccharophilus]MDG0831455.1 c-type cytochrome [Roseateles saccharophilus]TCU98662.1 cytochrome c [Roseateles saccharophilus]
MKTSLTLAALVASVALGLAGTAVASEKLAQEKQCMGCHDIKKDGAAPSFKKIAAFWKGRQDAEASLMRTIQQGSVATGGPHWAKARMPDQAERPLVSEAEARLLARWVLTQ